MECDTTDRRSLTFLLFDLMLLLVLFFFVNNHLFLHKTANQKLPHTMDPEYQAATRAYMRYHNMNPIFGISSQRQRNIDG